MVPRLSASASPGNLEIQILGLDPRPTESEAGRVGRERIALVFNKLSRSF